MKVFTEHARLIAVALTFLFSFTASVYADSDKLPFTQDTMPTELKKALKKLNIKDKLEKVSCLEGGSETRTVCTYKLGDFIALMIISVKGSRDDLATVTMICTASSDLASAKCLLSYAAAMMATTPEIDADARGKILKLLIDGLSLGNETRITTDERKFTLQKSMGIWFHVSASDIED